MQRSLMAIVAIVLSLAPQAGQAAEPANGLVEALARVPDSSAAFQQLVSYVDYRAIEAGRPGAAHPTSFTAFEALRAGGDPGARLWDAAVMGIASGSGDLLRSLHASGGAWPTLLGFDFFDVDREIAFGAPPADGVAFFGRFDPAAIADAFAARGYTGTDVGGRSLLCGPDGCDGGLMMHVDERDPTNPFGGDLGRLQPLGASASDLLSSASGDTVRAMLDAMSGMTPSLADDPAYRSVAEALAADATISQATIVPGAFLLTDVVTLLGLDDAAKTELERIAASFEPIPAYQLLAFADAATATEQVATVALVYSDATDAQRAVDVIPARLETLPSLRARTPLRQLLDDRGVGAVEGRVVPSADGTMSIAVITLRAPLASREPDPVTGRLTTSSGVYDLLVGMLASGDTLWLAPTIPALP